MLAALLASIMIAPPAELPHAAGWHVAAQRVPAAGCPRCVQTFSRASTVPYRDAANDFPQRTMPTLGPHDVIVQVTRSWEPSPPNWIHERHPLRIVRAQIHANFEGNPTNGRVSMWGRATWRSGSFVSVYVYFGAPRPTAATVARAQRELDGTRYAPWSIG